MGVRWIAAAIECEQDTCGECKLRKGDRCSLTGASMNCAPDASHRETATGYFRACARNEERFASLVAERKAARRERDYLRRWLRRWRTRRFLYDTEGKLVEIADVKSLDAEFDMALRGTAPPRRRK